ncbi:Protein of unknown function DUF2922 [Moorella glycerini]|uniref:DUF2922 domain-containing protein n=1 Tax=Neomoorella stamsii TaxID=1266720 RepID=A0A9X7J666_9FIRM|nr:MULTISPECIES: DUF2922 domain-containing protein [Moorella]PRR76737.1 hypothetical protein MOST_03810 [Moorella stamsii]CEP66729.1 Protein of unknown function DUF2922 [Moorella glycerini]
MLTKRLELIFQNAAGRRTTLAVQDPRDNLTEAEVRAAMELILDRNIFTSPGGDLTAIVGARIVTRDVTDIIAA